MLTASEDESHGCSKHVKLDLNHLTWKSRINKVYIQHSHTLSLLHTQNHAMFYENGTHIKLFILCSLKE